jgi:hypothetical protein
MVIGFQWMDKSMLAYGLDFMDDAVIVHQALAESPSAPGGLLSRGFVYYGGKNRNCGYWNTCSSTKISGWQKGYEIIMIQKANR